MNYRAFFALAFVTLFGCSSSTTSAPVPTSSGGGSSGGSSATAKRSYNGTASVGDFLSISVDPVAKTIAYTNHSNGDRGTAAYTVNADGSYALSDPSGDLTSAYEVPGYALIVAAQKAGPDHNAAALVTAVESGPITPATFSGQNYNFLQLRTTAGGFESGAIAVDAAGNINGQSYWPLGAFSQQGSPFLRVTGMSVAGAPLNASGTFFKLTHQGESNYIFGTTNGQFLVDTPYGAVLGLKQASSAAFDASYAGTYKSIYFEKQHVQTQQNNVETGVGTLKGATISIDATAHVTVTSSDGTTVLTGSLTPVSATPY